MTVTLTAGNTPGAHGGSPKAQPAESRQNNGVSGGEDSPVSKRR